MPDAEQRRAVSLAALIRHRRASLEWALLFFASIAAAIALCLGNGVARVDSLAYDALVRAEASPPSGAILIIAIDNASIAADGPWPWPRARHAALLERLAAARPKAVLYDMLFVDPAPAPADDVRLGRAAALRPTFFPLLLEAPGADGGAFHAQPPVAPVRATMAGSGQVVARADRDGVIRHVALAERIAGHCWPHLAATVMARMAGEDIRCDGARQAMLIPFAGPPGSFATASFAQAERGEIPPELISGKYVIVGATASGTGDRYATPMRGHQDLMSGVELQANILEGLLTKRVRHQAGPVPTTIFTLLPILILWSGFLWRGPRSNLALAALLIVAVLAASAAMLFGANLWLRPAPAILVMLVLLPLWGWRRLAAASDYLIGELDRLRAERGLDGQPEPSIAGDRIALQIGLLGNAIARMRATERQRDEMLRFLSHDMRQPQASILALLERDDGHVSDANGARIGDHARRTLALADNFVQIARAESAALVHEIVDLRDLLTDAADQLWDDAERRRVRIVLDLPDDEILVSATPGLIARAFCNLIDNAIKYGPIGGRVTVSLRVAADQAIAAVADEGPGVACEHVDSLFERFDRGGRSDAAGAGLGLVLVRAAAEAHRGSVGYEPATGGGARFVVRLPLAAG